MNQIPRMSLIQIANFGLPTDEILHKRNKNLESFTPFRNITSTAWSCEG